MQILEEPNQNKERKIRLALVNVADGAEPYGLIVISTYVKSKVKNADIKIININRRTGYASELNTPIEKYVTELEKYQPDIIGLSTMTIFYEKTKKTAKKIKEHPFLKNAPLFVAGTHITTLPESLDKSFDFALLEGGEITLCEILELLAKNKLKEENLEKIKGIAYFKENTLVKTETREILNNLDELPLPDKEYAYMNVGDAVDSVDGNYTTMMTSLGCPYKCIFCSTTIYWKNKIRFMSPQRVVNEIKMWHKDFNVKKIQIFDDLFTINKDRLKKISELLEKEGLAGKIKFGCRGKTSCIDEEMIQLLKKIGIVEINFGFESGSPRMLQYLKNNSGTLEDHKKAIELCNKYKIDASGSIIFGSPTETIDDMKLTLHFIDWCIENKISHLWSFVATPFPGTEMWKIAKQRDRVSDNMNFDLLSHQNIDDPLLLDPQIDKKEFKKIFYKARNKFKIFILKIWLERFKKHPIKTTISLLDDFRFIKFFTNQFE